MEDIDVISDGEEAPEQGITRIEAENLRLILSSTLRVKVFPTTHELIFSPEMLKNVEQNGWLSSEFIDAFTCLVNKRNFEYCAERELVSRKRTHVFSVFFMTLLISENLNSSGEDAQQIYSYDFRRVKGWMGKAGLKARNITMFMFPMLLNGNHWILFVSDRNRKRLTYYDPMGGPAGLKATEIIGHIKHWILDQYAHEKDSPPMDLNAWEVICHPKYPTQTDTDSCGVFVLYTIDCLERGIPPLFTQSDIPILRKRALLFLHANSEK